MVDAVSGYLRQEHQAVLVGSHLPLVGEPAELRDGGGCGSAVDARLDGCHEAVQRATTTATVRPSPPSSGNV
ncbi:hypothetical protein ACFZDJ_28250 [Streptomyces sp. NPDC007896]|uniref:hypothetical protein n=1 Tax=Streptomyces sp. NPDC007896 TaxID=3364784 RepID=UPI0036F0BDD2